MRKVCSNSSTHTANIYTLHIIVRYRGEQEKPAEDEAQNKKWMVPSSPWDTMYGEGKKQSIATTSPPTI